MIGDQHILPIYVIGGLVGAATYILSYYFVFGVVGSYMVGASAAIMALVIIAGRINPDKELNLILLGPIRIKFVILAFILIDLIMIGEHDNTGGHIAHIGGMIMGWLYYAQIGQRNDIESRINGIFYWIVGLFNSPPNAKRKSPLKVKFKSDKIKNMSEHRSDHETSMQQKVDEILDKIKRKGYASLTDIEKETLYQASKK